VSANGAIKYLFTWHALGDACEQCANLNGREWTDQDLYQNTIYDPVWGDVWDLNIDFPLTHGGTGAFCRCKLTVTVAIDWDKLSEFQKLTETINSEQILPKGQEIFSVTVPVGEIDLSTVSEMKAELSSLTGKIDELEQKSGKAELSLRQEIRTINIMMSLLERMTGSPDVEQASRRVSQLIMILMRLKMTILAVEAATGPWGWLYAGANIAATAMLISDASMSLGE
jgi:hypothetical protein